MSELSNFLIESILDGDEKSSPTIALFGGGFKPPTKGHLEVVLQGIEQNPDIDKIYIAVGAKVRGGVTQDESVKVWEKYQKLIPIESEIIPVGSPFEFYKEYLKSFSDDKVYIFMGAREGNEGDDFDVVQRSDFIKKYSDNVIPVKVSTAGGISGTLSRKYLTTDPDRFVSTLPDQLSIDDKKEVYNTLINEEIEKKFLYAFDLDDTLITSKSDVIVTNPKQGTFRLTPAEYALYEPGPEDELDFSEFAKLKNPKTIKDNFNKFSQILKRTSDLRNTQTIILTARQPEVSTDLEAFLEKRNLPQVKLHAVGDSSPEAKKKVLQNYIDQGYNKIRFYDDSPKNIEVVKTLNSPETEVITKLVVTGPFSENKKDHFGLIQFVNEVVEEEDNSFDYTPYLDSLNKHMEDNGMNIQPTPKIKFIDDDADNAADILGKTAFYDPNQREITLFTMSRHPKDVLRSYAHEMIHHIQNLEDRLGNITTTDTREDDHLTQIEKEAYTDGNITFRKWTETLTEGQLKEISIRSKDEIKHWALNADLISILQNNPSKFEQLEDSLEGGRLKALYYFWDLIKQGELNEDIEIVDSPEPELTIYCDMDGVLCDFEKRFEEFGHMPPREYEKKYGTKQFWKLIDEEVGIRFWVGMPWMPDGKELWNFLKPFNPTLLSAPSRNNESRLGKRLWVRNHIPGTKLILASKFNKPQYSQKNSILIDDMASTIEKWDAEGGIGILHTSAVSTIEQLKQLGL